MTLAELRLEEVARRSGGTILRGSPAIVFRGYTIDARLARPDDLFFAVLGNRDGHDFLAQAAENGARGAVVSRDFAAPSPGFALVKVPDAVAALQRLAGSVLRDAPVRVVGITGSAGKTTTKEFTAGLLASSFSVLKSEKNFNNHLGLALSLLRLEKGHEIAVLEMGMSAPGEIAVLTRIAPPDVAVITNIHPVHLEFFGSLEGIARAKKEILDGMKPEGTAVLNADDPQIAAIAASWKGKRVLFGRSPAWDIRAANVRNRGAEGLSFDLGYGRETAPIDLPFVYESFIDDFLAAAGVAYALAVPLEAVTAAAPSLRPFAMRGVMILMKSGVRVLDDSYNSNPRALETALKSLAALPAARKVAVLGDMLELGPAEKEFHLEAGRTVARSGWDLLVTVGPLARGMADGAAAAGMPPAAITVFDGVEEASRGLAGLLKEGDLVLVKGSRGVRMEKIVESLRDRNKE